MFDLGRFIPPTKLKFSNDPMSILVQEIPPNVSQITEEIP